MTQSEVRIPEQELNRQNMVIAMLTQALLGSITPNFRRISINPKLEPWPIEIILERDDQLDREEISDIEAEFESLLSAIGNPAFDVQVTVSDENIQWRQYPWIPVFARKES
jgi:hypothetical protein